MTTLSDQMCSDIERLELNAPRVTKQEIDALMAQVEFQTHVVPGTNTTHSLAIYNGFLLAIGETSCIHDANFNAKLGAKYAIEDAKVKAVDKLWELEGWRLKRHLESRVFCVDIGDLSPEEVKSKIEYTKRRINNVK